MARKPTSSAEYEQYVAVFGAAAARAAGEAAKDGYTALIDELKPRIESAGNSKMLSAAICGLLVEAYVAGYLEGSGKAAAFKRAMERRQREAASLSARYVAIRKAYDATAHKGLSQTERVAKTTAATGASRGTVYRAIGATPARVSRKTGQI